ncbi:MAG: flagellin [Desulfovibrionaceae bacterium]|nr:flagellin [Desulfovibrionaceae bacterium]
MNSAGESYTFNSMTVKMGTDQNESAGTEEIQITSLTEPLVFIIGGHANGVCNNYNLRIKAKLPDTLTVDELREALEKTYVEAQEIDGATYTQEIEHYVPVMNLETQERAQKMLAKIDNAITRKDTIRAHLGALQNRLENTLSNITLEAENLQMSESRISDIDVGSEMTNFVRNQILTQSAVAMLSQANSTPQMALQLIGA